MISKKLVITVAFKKENGQYEDRGTCFTVYLFNLYNFVLNTYINWLNNSNHSCYPFKKQLIKKLIKFMLMITLYAEQKKKKTQIYRTVFQTLWEKARVGCFKRTALKHVYYLG